jgi:Na+-transporting methylmalonyl-CoA/oxaloacetate decarboxylase gamma subunit
MDNSKFSIFESVKNGYLFVGREWVYLFKAGILPVVMQIGTSLFIQFQRADASVIEGYLWGLPATVLFAWFTFIEMRLLILGEKLDRLPQDAGCLGDRQRAMKLSVITSLLFNMAMSMAIATLLASAESAQWGAEWAITLAGLFITGAMFWGVRFGVLPILAAVHYPFRPFLKQVSGMMFSLRLLGMGMVCLFPVAFLFQIFIVSFMSRLADTSVQFKMTPPEQITIIVASAFLSLLVTALLNAAAAHALKQLLGSNRDGVLA